ncbi:ferredoxin [Nonomuraea roseola]|uniref:Ferredoxin n=1 Tax=Nonomuraea roseola TaxID=46179 RepID=A0ABV5Q5Z3_9ACTN
MRVTADTGVCVGAGMCALTVPAVFDQSEEEGVVVVLRSEVPAGLEQSVRRALTLCPSGALAAL